MGVIPAVLVLDDGELDDVQRMLQDMAIPYARIRGGAIVHGHAAAARPADRHAAPDRRRAKRRSATRSIRRSA